MKIEADGDAGHGKARHQNACNEVVRGEPRQRRVEVQHDRAAQSGRGEKPQLRALVGEAEQRRRGLEETARMRLEGERGRRPGKRLGARQRCPDHGAMAAMHAVEITDGDDGAVERLIRGRFAADDDERLCWLRLVRHGGDRMGLDRSLITLAPVIARLPREFKQAGAAGARFGSTSSAGA